MLQSGRIKNFYLDLGQPKTEDVVNCNVGLHSHGTSILTRCAYRKSALPTPPFCKKISSSSTLGKPSPFLAPDCRDTPATAPEYMSSEAYSRRKDWITSRCLGTGLHGLLNPCRISPFRGSPGRGEWHPQENGGDTREDARSVVGRIHGSSHMVQRGRESQGFGGCRDNQAEVSKYRY